MFPLIMPGSLTPGCSSLSLSLYMAGKREVLIIPSNSGPGSKQKKKKTHTPELLMKALSSFQQSSTKQSLRHLKQPLFSPPEKGRNYSATQYEIKDVNLSA